MTDSDHALRPPAALALPSTDARRAARILKAGALAAAVMAWLALLAWARPLYLPDEGRYAGVAWEMFSTGHWAVPTLNGLPFFHKPPLYYWLGSAAMHLFGPTAFAVRVPSLLGATALALALALFTRRWVGARQAPWIVALLATQPFFYLGAQFANLDMLVAACIGCTVLLGAHAMLLQARGAPYRAPLIGAYAVAALGVLAKGLIGAVLPALILPIWLLACGRARQLPRLFSATGVLVFLLLGLPWFLLMQQRYPGFFDYFVVYHHLRRFAAGGFNNVEPFWYYPVALALLALPSSLALPWVWRRRALDEDHAAVRLLMLSWMLVVLVFFSLPRSKPVGYVMPALAPLAWLLGDAVLSRGPLGRRLLVACVGIAGVASAMTVLAVARAHPHSHAVLGRVLLQAARAGEPVVYGNQNPYDIAFYARLRASPLVMSDWDDPHIAQHDDWRKELQDAAAFEPAQGAARLLRPAALPAFACRQPVTWWVSKAEPPAGLPARAVRTAVTPESSLWRLQRDDRLCRALSRPAAPGVSRTSGAAAPG